MAEITHQQVIELVKTLPAERLGSLFDFALFLKVRPQALTDVEDIFGETSEEIEADEAWWSEQFRQTESGLLRLAEEAAEDYRIGNTTPMEFDEQGRLRR